MKRIFALVLCATLALSLLACGAKDPTPTTPAPSDPQNIAEATAAGQLIFSTEASVTISYEKTGLVIKVEGANSTGDLMVEDDEPYVGKSCEDVVAELVTLSIENSYLTHNIVVKPVPGSVMPSEDFLDKIISKAQATADGAYANSNAIAVPADKVDDYGYIDHETAKSILLSMLELEKATTLMGQNNVDSEGQYLFYVEEGEIKGHYLLDATLCTIEALSDDDPRLWGDEDTTSDPVVETEETTSSEEAETPNVPEPTTGEEDAAQ